MNLVEEATNVVNDALKMEGEDLIPIPKVGSTKQRLETLLDAYTHKLIAKNRQYKIYKNKRDIPEIVVMYLNDMINNQV